MLGEHEIIARLVRQLSDAADAVQTAATAYALQEIFESHLSKENELVLPLLVSTPGVSVVDLLGDVHELLGPPAAAAGCGHQCACGELDEELPELDARSIPHAIRHATILGALETVRPGAGLVLLAPHDPLPLLAQIEERWPGVFTVSYDERGPQTWKLRLTRTA
jgi:uncharacterized protein (DUF2249 family)